MVAFMVGEEGLEPSREFTSLDFKSNVSTSSTTRPRRNQPSLLHPTYGVISFDSG
jgi:hypothetical protein